MVDNCLMRPAERMACLSRVVVSALGRAGACLSEMAGVEIHVGSSRLELVALTDVVEVTGSSADVVVAIYVAVLGDGRGHVLLLMDESVAQRLTGLLLCEDVASIVISDDLPVSALAEVGNVTCTGFMNVLGDATGMRLDVSPPAVVQDMRGAILDAIVADIALLGEEALLVDTSFLLESRDSLEVRLLVIPSPETLERLLALASRVPTRV